MPSPFNRHSVRLQLFTKVLVLFFVFGPVLTMLCSAESTMEGCTLIMSLEAESELPHNCGGHSSMTQCHIDDFIIQIAKNDSPKFLSKLFSLILLSFTPLTSFSPQLIPLAQHPSLSPIEIPLVFQKFLLLV